MFVSLSPLSPSLSLSSLSLLSLSFLLPQVKDRSSTYSNEGNVRRDGSYIYENFMATDGSDVKVKPYVHVHM